MTEPYDMMTVEYERLRKLAGEIFALEQIAKALREIDDREFSGELLKEHKIQIQVNETYLNYAWRDYQTAEDEIYNRTRGIQNVVP